MGMFDTFVGKVKCSNCGELHKINYQTKEYDCLLNEFNIGDRVDDRRGTYNLKLNEKCTNCGIEFIFWAKINHGVLIKYTTDENDLINLDNNYIKHRLQEIADECADYDTVLKLNNLIKTL